MFLYQGIKFETLRELIDFAMYHMAMNNPEKAELYGYTITFTNYK